jgi:hypothetical protein
MLRVGWRLAGLASLMVSLAAAAQDRSTCTGIYCPQGRASGTAAELAPYMAPGKTWEQVKGQTALVMKYYNRDGTLASTRVFPQSAYLQATASQPGKVAFMGQGTPTIALYGLSPCRRTGTFEFSGERFTCDTLWREQLNDNLFATQAVLCRAYVDQVDRPVQEATCLRADEGSGKLTGGIVIDDTLVGLGSAVLTRDASGKPLRPELAGAEKTGAAILAGGGR